MTKLHDLITSRDDAMAQLERIELAIRHLGAQVEQQHDERERLGEELTAASVELALSGIGLKNVADLTQRKEAVVRSALQNIQTIEALRTKRERAENFVKMAKLAVAQEVQHVATPEWDSATVACLAAWDAFLSAVRHRAQLGSTATSYFSAAGSTNSPCDEENVLVASFAGVGGLSDGLLDRVRDHELKVTSRGLGFLPGNSIQLLSEADLLKLAERKAAAE